MVSRRLPINTIRERLNSSPNKRKLKQRIDLLGAGKCGLHVLTYSCKMTATKAHEERKALYAIAMKGLNKNEERIVKHLADSKYHAHLKRNREEHRALFEKATKTEKITTAGYRTLRPGQVYKAGDSRINAERRTALLELIEKNAPEGAQDKTKLREMAIGQKIVTNYHQFTRTINELADLGIIAIDRRTVKILPIQGTGKTG